MPAALRPAQGARGPARRPFRLALLGVAAALVLTMDDRHAGKGSDGRQMIGTAVALVETGGIGLGRGEPRTVDRAGGDRVSRYGLGASLAQVPAALLAPAGERRLGPGTSQPLFLLAPLLSVLLACVAAAGVARLLGASPRGEAWTVVLTGLGSHLGSYAALDYGEPMQAASVAGALALALGATSGAAPRSGVRLAAGAGACAGAAVLVKSSLAVVGPLCLLPLLAADPARTRRLGAAAAGAAPPLLGWLALELARFGAPFAAYGGEGFSHPVLDGLWRLLVGPNRGLLWFFPACVVAGRGLLAALRGPAGRVRLAAAGCALAALALLLTSASWWAWHGAGGWGPRLLAPAVPLRSPWAGWVAGGWSRRAGAALVAASVLANLPPLLVHPALVDVYVANCRRAALTPSLAREVPPLAIEPDEHGRPSVSPDQVLPLVPGAAHHVAFVWHLVASRAGAPDQVAQRLARPPGREARPDLGPRLSPIPAEIARLLAPPPRLHFLGRGFFSGIEDPATGAVYLGALADQVRRAQETGEPRRALALARRRAALVADEESDALLLESWRLLGEREAALEHLRGAPADRRESPPVQAVLALWARDLGDAASARAWAAVAASAFPGTPLARDVGAPEAWPRTFAELTRRAEPKILPGAPSFGARDP